MYHLICFLYNWNHQFIGILLGSLVWPDIMWYLMSWNFHEEYFNTLEKPRARRLHHIEASNVEVVSLINTLRQRRNGQHFADNIFTHIFINENVWISINISLKFVPKGPINNIPALVQIMAWRHSGDKPLSEPMMDSLPMQLYTIIDTKGSLREIFLTLTHWSCDKMAAISQTTFSSAFPWMKTFQF